MDLGLGRCVCLILGLNETVSSLGVDSCFRLNLGADFLLMFKLRFLQCLVLLFVA